MDTKLTNLIRRLNECRRRRALLLAFAHSPIDTTYALLAAEVGRARGCRPGMRLEIAAGGVPVGSRPGGVCLGIGSGGKCGAVG